MSDTLSTLDLTEKPGQRITVFQHARHFQEDQRVDRTPGESVFSSGPHHSFYSYTKETPMPPFSMLQQEPFTESDRRAASAIERASRLPTDAPTRKSSPIYSGVIRYFPDALAEIARLSFIGNEKHNPGQPLHWARSKSTDELDCLVRHLTDAGTVDTDGFLHDVKIAWRALSNLQKTLEQLKGLPISPGSRP